MTSRLWSIHSLLGTLTLVKVEEMVVEEHWRVSGDAGAAREETNLELSSDISLSSCQKHNKVRGLSTL